MSDFPGLVTLSTVEPQRVEWLWPGHLPRGKLVVIDGDPSTGKSTLTLDLAARVTTGTSWPDGSACVPGDVLVMSAEDGIEDTVTPRAVAAGADRSRLHALSAVPVTHDDGTVSMVPPSLPRDIGYLERVISHHGIKLVTVDVLMAYLNSGVDSHRDQDVRGVLHHLADMAERTGCTVILIRHLNKAGGSNALYRGGGSIGIVGAARAAFLVARDPEDTDRRIFAVTKSNLALEPPALAYRLVSDPATGCARVQWEAEPLDGVTAASLLRTPNEGEEDDRNAAQSFVLDHLSENGGEAPARDVIKAGRAAGFNETEMKDARRRSRSPRIQSRKSGFGGAWVWAIETEGGNEGGIGGKENLLPPSPPMEDEMPPSQIPHHVPGTCTVCSEPLHASTISEGFTTHPGCEVAA